MQITSKAVQCLLMVKTYQLTEEARKAIPFSFEAKYKEKGLSNVYSAYEQAQRQTANIPTTEYIYSVAVVQQKGHDPLVVMSADDLFRLMPKLQGYRK